MKKVAGLLVLLLSLTVLSGCAELIIAGAAGAGAVGGMKYIEGKLEKQYPVEYIKAWDATNTALANLQYSISGSLNEETRGDIEAVKKDGTKVYISLKDMGQKVTTIGVRVGTFGDRDESERIHSEIAAVAGI